MKNKVEVNTDRLSKNPIDIMENCLFTNLVEENFRKSPIFLWADLLDFIAIEYNLKCRFCEIGMIGKKSEIDKAFNILSNSIKYN